MRKKIFRCKKRENEESWVVREYLASGNCKNPDSHGTVCLKCGICGRIFLFGHLVSKRCVFVVGNIFWIIIIIVFLKMLGGVF